MKRVHTLARVHVSATHCNTLQHTATHCNTNICMNRVHTLALVHVSATHCNTLQRSATHCNTLQHTASHCATCDGSVSPPKSRLATVLERVFYDVPSIRLCCSTERRQRPDGNFMGVFGGEGVVSSHKKSVSQQKRSVLGKRDL